jgi:hypothetical protein
MSTTSEQYYVPVDASGYGYPSVGTVGYPVGYFPSSYVLSPKNVTETVINPVPRVSEVQIHELLPFKVSPSFTIHNWVVRSNRMDRGQLANQMLLAWRPDDLDYGSEYDTTSLPQVYLFNKPTEASMFQKQLYTDYPELNIRMYKLKTPVRINTHTLPGASLVPSHSVIIPTTTGYDNTPSAVILPDVNQIVNATQESNLGPYSPITLPEEVVGGPGGPGFRKPPSKRRSSKRSSKKKSRTSKPRSRKSK